MAFDQRVQPRLHRGDRLVELEKLALEVRGEFPNSVCCTTTASSWSSCR